MKRWANRVSWWKIVNFEPLRERKISQEVKTMSLRKREYRCTTTEEFKSYSISLQRQIRTLKAMLTLLRWGHRAMEWRERGNFDKSINNTHLLWLYGGSLRPELIFMANSVTKDYESGAKLLRVDLTRLREELDLEKSSYILTCQFLKNLKSKFNVSSGLRSISIVIVELLILNFGLKGGAELTKAWLNMKKRD